MKYKFVVLFLKKNVLVINVCFQIYFLMDHHCKTKSELSDSIEKDRICWVSYRVLLVDNKFSAAELQPLFYDCQYMYVFFENNL